MNTAEAIHVQYDVLKELGMSDEEKIAHFVRLYGKTMRDIINTFTQKTGRDPTAYDILWCLGCEICRDPREVIHSLPHDTYSAN